MLSFANPFTPGAGHPPPYLAGRVAEKDEFTRILEQERILENLVLTGLRGVGKTVLLNSLQPEAASRDWLWVGADLSQETSFTEENFAARICADLAKYTSQFRAELPEKTTPGFTSKPEKQTQPFDYSWLLNLYQETPGLQTDKLKAVISFAAELFTHHGKRGIVFAYDEAQNMSDRPQEGVYCLSVLLDTFSSLQKSGLRVLLALTGLPTLFPKLVEARTYAERMFRVVVLEELNEQESEDAIRIPIEREDCPVKLDDESVQTIVKLSGGYPYFIQYICRETYDAFIQLLDKGEIASVPVPSIVQKLDTDFFAGRYAKASDRQRELLWAISTLDGASSEFTVQEIEEASKSLPIKPFSSSHINQMLNSLSSQGLIYRNRHGKYSFAVPMLAGYILRQHG